MEPKLKKNKTIFDKVKKYEDALDVLDITGNGDASYRIGIIAKALNEGWKPDWENGNQKN